MGNAGDAGAVHGKQGSQEVKAADEEARDTQERTWLRPVGPSQEPVGVSVQGASVYLRSRERSTASDPARNEIPATARLGSTSGAAPLGVLGLGGGGGPQGLCAKAGELNASTMPSTRVEDFHLAIMGSPSFVNRRRTGVKQRHASHAALCRVSLAEQCQGFSAGQPESGGEQVTGASADGTWCQG